MVSHATGRRAVNGVNGDNLDPTAMAAYGAALLPENAPDLGSETMRRQAERRIRLRVAGLVTSALAMLMVTACTGSSNETAMTDAWDGEVWDSAGVRVVENRDNALWRIEDRWSVTEVVKIGDTDGPPEYVFTSISAVELLSDGRFVVADWANELKFFSPAGVHERTVGRSGSGPG